MVYTYILRRALEEFYLCPKSPAYAFHLCTDTHMDRARTFHYIDVIMTTMASQMTSLTVVYSTVYSGADQEKHQSSAPLAFVWGIHRDRWLPRTQMVSYAENVSISWRQHVSMKDGPCGLFASSTSCCIILPASLERSRITTHDTMLVIS